MAITEKEKLYTSIIKSFNNSNLPYAVIKNYELFH